MANGWEYDVNRCTITENDINCPSYAHNHLQWRREKVSAISNASPDKTLVEWIARLMVDDDAIAAAPLGAAEVLILVALLASLDEVCVKTRGSDRRRAGDRIAMVLLRFVYVERRLLICIVLMVVWCCLEQKNGWNVVIVCPPRRWWQPPFAQIFL